MVYGLDEIITASLFASTVFDNPFLLKPHHCPFYRWFAFSYKQNQPRHLYARMFFYRYRYFSFYPITYSIIGWGYSIVRPFYSISGGFYSLIYSISCVFPIILVMA